MFKKKITKSQSITTKRAGLLSAIKKNGFLKYTNPQVKHFCKKIIRFYKKHRLSSRIAAATMAIIILFSVFVQLIEYRQNSVRYNISAKAEKLLKETSPLLGKSLKYDVKTQAYVYNKDYQPSQEVGGLVASPKFSANFYSDIKKGVDIIDPKSKASFNITPDIKLQEPKKQDNRVIYPIYGKKAAKVYTLGSIGMKEDIILEDYQGDSLKYTYNLRLDSGTEARIENDGSLAIYGVDLKLLGNVTTATEKDAKLLEQARQNGAKTNLLFSFPAPYVLDSHRKISNAKAWFDLKDNELTVYTKGLKDVSYPASIDPSVYIETAAKLMRGNNETNIDFDVDNELIQKGKTTGARFDAWSAGMQLNEGRWDQGTAVAGGYVYAVGGKKSDTVTTSYTTAGTDTYTVPAGVTSIIIKAWGGGAGGGGSSTDRVGGNGGGSGYAGATIAVSAGQTINVYIGGAGVGGSYTASQYMGDGGGGGGYSGIARSGTTLLIAAGGGGGGGGDGDSGSTGRAAGSAGGAGGGTSGIAGSGNGTTTGGGLGTPTTGGAEGAATSTIGTGGSSLQGGTGSSRAETAGSATTNGGGAGGDGQTGTTANRFPGGGGGGGGYYGGGGGGRANVRYNGGGGGGGGSSYTTGSLTTNTAGSGVNPGNASDSDRGGAGQGGAGGVVGPSNGTSGTAGKVMISYQTNSGANTVEKGVYWAKFSTTNNSIVSTNPGNGVCTNWCTDSAYDLPSERAGFSLVAYNGFLYAIGGVNSAGTRQSTVYIAKIGANGEPQLWHPTNTDKATWTYWYSDTALSTERSNSAAVAYNNRLYLLGGQTTASPGGVNTVQYANMNPTGTLGSWSSTGMSVLPSARHNHTAQVYNDRLYLIGGNSSGALQNTAYYAKLNSDGTMNSWVQTSSFATARQSWGGSITTVWGGYVYLAGGCSAVNGSGYCTTVASDMQLASINADGSLAEWNTIVGLTSNRMGYGLVAWRNTLYGIGGCTAQSATTGNCTGVLAETEYGVINQDGDASTVYNSEPSGTAPCSGTSPYNCDIPPAGDNAGQGGQMSSAIVINNGYIYVVGGCTDVSATDECSTSTGMSGNTSYAALSSAGTIVSPETCSGTSYGTWCVDSTNRINGTAGIGAASATVFNNTIYVVGGTNGTAWQTNIWRVSLNTNGSLSGAWVSQSFANLDLDMDAGTAGYQAMGYSYTFSRANPSSAGTYPGNLYVLGGCQVDGGAGIGCNEYYTAVYKCNILTTGVLEEADANDCTMTGQLQIDADNINAGNQGLGLMAGTIYANRVYLVGGSCATIGNASDPCGSTYAANRRDTIYAHIDNSNNIVAESGGVWQFATGQMDPVRRRAVSFGYNGYVYSLAGYSGTASLQDLLFAKIDVSTGDIGTWSSSGVVVTPRWDLRAIVSNGYVYAIGGCGTGSAPSGCTAMQPEVQTFQLYNNDSGAPVDYVSASDDTYTADTDRWGASATVYNGYIYVAGGCISTTDCTTATNSVQYAPISTSDGSIGTWAAGGNLPAVRAWGQLEVAGGTLYYIGGQDSTSTNEQSTVYYTTGISAGNPTWSASAATNGLPAARTKFSAAVWNDRIYATGGLDSGAAATNTVYVSPQLNSGGNITSAWSASITFNVNRSGQTTIAYANNLYVFGGYDGTNYLNDSQYTQINSDGTVDSWNYTTSLPTRLSQADGFAYNGYLYLIGGRSATAACVPNTLVTPISANTTIASGNNPTGVGEWYETNQKYPGGRYGAAVAYDNGKAIVLGGGCTAPIGPTYTTGTISQTTYTVTGNGTSWTDNFIGGTITYSGGSTAIITGVNSATSMTVAVSKTVGAGTTYSIAVARHSYTALKAQPQVAKFSKMIDTDTDVFPTKWLMNGLDNATGAEWYMRYRSSTVSAAAWGQETNFGKVTLGQPETYTPLNSGGTNTNFARYFYFSTNIDSSQAFGYPEDVNRGPTIWDLSLFFTSDPSKRMRHGKTFTGGEQQPLDTPF